MKTIEARINHWLAWFHRWAGVILSLLFLMWFASGGVLHFVGFPSLSADEQRASSEVIDLTQVSVAPAAALSSVPFATGLRLIGVDGSAVYIVDTTSGIPAVVAANTGRHLPFIDSATAQRIGASFGRRPAASIDGPFHYDQWIVHQRFDSFRPVFRVRLDDPERTDVYVSARTGEVVQRTRHVERTWNWCGAIVHWIYFTPLRKSWSKWNQVVWWLSLTSLLSSSVGAWLGILRWRANCTAGRRGVSPFRGWMRWHHIIGLFGSLIVIAYILSGWLSMDHGRLFAHGEATDTQTKQLRGMSLTKAVGNAIPASMMTLSPTTELTFNAVNGRRLLTAYGPSSAAPRVLLLDQSSWTLNESLPNSLLLAGVERIWPNVTPCPMADGFDALYRLAESAGTRAAAFCVNAPSSVRSFVDRSSGRLLTVMDPSRRRYAWVYYALHTMQFPILINHPVVRTTLVLAFLTLGFALSATGVVLSFSRLRREFP